MTREYRKLSMTLMLLPAMVLMAVTAPAMADKKKGALVIKEQGSFFLGGEVKNRGPNDDVTINQMYVQFQVPNVITGVPVVFTHGCCLSSATWETTPDGRMGWDEYFLRHGHPVYLTDQTGRGRSGFDATPFNLVRDGKNKKPPRTSQPSITHASHQFAWNGFRFGPSFGIPWPDEQFPTENFEELPKQMIPDIRSGLPSPNPLWTSLSDLAVQLNGAVLVGHSQSGNDPFEAALTNPQGIKGLISIEGAACNVTGFTSGQIAALAAHPILVVFGDHLGEGVTGAFWQANFEGCLAFIDLVNDVPGGNAEMLYPPELGIFGNSHMLMQDKNSDQIADLILEWIKDNVDGAEIAAN